MNSTSLAECIRSGRQRRVMLNCGATVIESDGCILDVHLLDMSTSEFRLRSVEELEVGSAILLQMADTRPVQAQICWSCGHEAGGVFLDPIAN